MRGLVCAVLTALIATGAWSSALGDVDSDRARTLIETGSLENISAAIAIYTAILEKDPANYEIQWRCARAYRNLATVTAKHRPPGWKKQNADYGKKGMAHATAAIALAPTLPDGHYAYALTVGTYADSVGILTAFKEGLKNKVQSSLEKAYAVDPRYDDSGPTLALGRFWAMVPWPFKSKKKALKYYQEFLAHTRHQVSDEERMYYVAELFLQLKDPKYTQQAKEILTPIARSGRTQFRQKAEALLSKSTAEEAPQNEATK